MDEFDKWCDDIEAWWQDCKRAVLFIIGGFALVILLAWWSNQ